MQETDTQQHPNQQQQQPGSSKVSSRPKLLVCHDMRGGYLDYEALLSGSTEASQYRIWHWDCECRWGLVGYRLGLAGASEGGRASS